MENKKRARIDGLVCTNPLSNVVATTALQYYYVYSSQGVFEVLPAAAQKGTKPAWTVLYYYAATSLLSCSE